MNVEIGTEATQFPEKEYINGIFLAVRGQKLHHQIRKRKLSLNGRRSQTFYLIITVLLPIMVPSFPPLPHSITLKGQFHVLWYIDRKFLKTFKEILIL
jgi:hypothetical protein